MYIKVSNNGVLDVPVACNMLGASVKVTDGAIGMFGSGLKYALAQACRMGFEIHIASGDHVYRVETRSQEFRNKMFKKVVLREIFENTIHETPITTEFGQHDWKDKWFVYRELVCNAMDEPGFSKSLVSDLRRSKTKTSFYLLESQFGEFYKDHQLYFPKDSGNWIKPGTGLVYKRGVRVGVLPGINLDFQDSYVGITESREVDEWNAFWRLGTALNGCSDATVWEAFVKSERKDRVDISFFEEDVKKAFNSGCKKAFGDYALCPDVHQVISDLQIVGCYPFVIPTGWKLPTGLPTFRDKVSLTDMDVIRNPNAKEEELLSWGLDCARAFGLRTDIPIKVFSSEKRIEGLKKEDEVYLREDVFENKERFLGVLFHEIGHLESGAGDYDRDFSEFFIKKIVNFIVS